MSPKHPSCSCGSKIISLLILATLAILQLAYGYHDGADEPICWRTDTTTGVTTMYEPCEDGLSIEYLGTQEELLGNNFRQGEAGEVAWKCASSFVPYPVAVSGVSGTWDISHSNIHSCESSVGFCTPFISNTPGLSTHTAALYANMEVETATTTNGVTEYSNTFSHNLQLVEGWYGVIAHCRIYESATVKWDIAASWNFVEVAAPENLKEVSKRTENVVIGLSVVCGMVLLVTLGLTIEHRDHTVMKLSQVVFLEGMILCAMICCAGTFTLSNPTELKCGLKPWMSIVPLTMLFSLLFAKTWRIIKVVGSSSAMKRVVVKAHQVVTLATGLTMVQVIIQATGQGVLGLKPTKVFDSNDIDYVERCGDGNYELFWWLSAAYCGVLLLVGAYCADKAKELMSLFNESKYIAMSMYNATFFGAVLLMIYVSLSHEPNTYFLFASVMELAIVTSTIVVLMYPKFILIWNDTPLSLKATAGLASNSTHSSVNESGPGKMRGRAPSSCDVINTSTAGASSIEAALSPSPTKARREVSGVSDVAVNTAVVSVGYYDHAVDDVDLNNDQDDDFIDMDKALASPLPPLTAGRVATIGGSAAVASKICFSPLATSVVAPSPPPPRAPPLLPTSSSISRGMSPLNISLKRPGSFRSKPSLSARSHVTLSTGAATKTNEAQEAMRHMIRLHMCGLTIPKDQLQKCIELQERSLNVLRQVNTLDTSDGTSPDNDNTIVNNHYEGRHHHDHNNFNSNHSNSSRHAGGGGDIDGTIAEENVPTPPMSAGYTAVSFNSSA